MKNILLAAIVVAVITSCDKVDKNESAEGITVSGTLEFSERYDEITTVEVSVLEQPNEDNSPIFFSRAILARGPYSNGDFSIKLPEKVDDKYLIRIPYSKKGFESYFEVSGESVKTVTLFFSITTFDEEMAKIVDEKNKEGNGVYGYLYKEFPLVYMKKDDISTTEGGYCYADRNFSITGSITIQDEGSLEWSTETFMIEKTVAYSMHLKQGWNIVYYTQTEYMETPDKQIRKTESTTNPVSGLKWYVRGDF